MKKVHWISFNHDINFRGCSMMESESKKDTKAETKSVPEEMEASKYVGQGFQPPAEKDAIEFAKKHRKEFEK